MQLIAVIREFGFLNFIFLAQRVRREDRIICIALYTQLIAWLFYLCT